MFLLIKIFIGSVQEFCYVFLHLFKTRLKVCFLMHYLVLAVYLMVLPIPANFVFCSSFVLYVLVCNAD